MSNFMNKVTRKVNRIGFKFKKHSPEILVVAGVAGVVTSGVMACRATTKLSEVLEESKSNIDLIHNYVETEGFSEKYTEEDSKKDLTITYVQSGLKIAKLYAPAVAVGALSITAILASHKILRTRNIALAAAYSAIDRSFKDYRGRVVERFGEALDRELRYNIKAEEVEVTEIDKNGKEKTTKQMVNVVDPNTISDYARIYCEGNTGWEKDPEYNLMFLKRMQASANDMLQCKGHLFLNEVYDMLGFPRSKAGQVVGWIYDEKNPIGDNFVDFGIYNINDECKQRFVNGLERSILLDFNVDGNILEYM